VTRPVVIELGLSVAPDEPDPGWRRPQVGCGRETLRSRMAAAPEPDALEQEGSWSGRMPDRV
jgi:hypothetical protein